MKITILGTGTSTGVPVAGCHCRVCSSPRKENKRLRTSVLIELPSKKNILIDTSTDLRLQALRADISRIDAVLYTHTHADHVFGIDDLRSYNFIAKAPIAVYASESSAAELERMFRYAFTHDPHYEGGAAPRLTLHRLAAYKPLSLFDCQILPLPILHGRLEVYGYRIGSFAYLTDCSTIPDATRDHLQDLDVLILDGLRTRAHPTHFTHQQAAAEAAALRPKKTYLTHISHEIEHEEGNAYLKTLTDIDIEIAHDGLELEL